MTNEQPLVNVSMLVVGEKFTYIFKRVMQERQYKIDDLVRLTGLSKRTIYRAFDPEDTTTSFRTIAKLCVALDITLSLSLEQNDEKSSFVWCA